MRQQHRQTKTNKWIWLINLTNIAKYYIILYYYYYYLIKNNIALILVGDNSQQSFKPSILILCQKLMELNNLIHEYNKPDKPLTHRHCRVRVSYCFREIYMNLLTVWVWNGDEWIRLFAFEWTWMQLPIVLLNISWYLDFSWNLRNCRCGTGLTILRAYFICAFSMHIAHCSHFQSNLRCYSFQISFILHPSIHCWPWLWSESIQSDWVKEEWYESSIV